MSSTHLLASVLLAVSALAAPLFNHAKPISRSRGLTGFLVSSGTPRRLGRLRTHRKQAAANNNQVYIVTATAYQAVPGQTDSEPFVTADNSLIKPYYGSKKHWMALSRDMLKKNGGTFDYGDKVQVTGISPELDGVYTIHDTMNRRHRHCMDVLTHVSEKYDIFQKGVKIQKVVEAPELVEELELALN